MNLPECKISVFALLIKSYMKKHLLLLSAAAALSVFFILFLQSVYSHQNSSTCITCHTDENKIKSLYKPPKIEFKEEGEG